jgi:hypothetical protein
MSLKSTAHAKAIDYESVTTRASRRIRTDDLLITNQMTPPS